ncbi:MAG: DUF6390 family protein [Patescibacteria group bacterium]|jgi:hypothetical protein
MSSKEGLIEAARFSWNCQPDNKMLCDGLYGFVRGNGGHDVEWIERQLKNLYSYFYYLLIARQNGISDPFDLNVVQAHWIGNDLLRIVKPEDVKKLQATGELKALPKEKEMMILWLLNNLVKSGSCPHHSFHATVNEKLNPDLIRQGKRCFVECGKVIELEDNYFIVDIDGNTRKCGYGFLKGKIQVGNLVLIHLNEGRRIADLYEKMRLDDWSAITMSSLKLI